MATQPGFTWTPVAGASAVNTAAQNVVQAQQNAANTIDKSLKTLSGIGADITEKKAEQFNTVAELNLQEELNKITDIDDVKTIKDFEIDVEDLRSRFGEQLGRTGFEPSIARLRGAVEQRQKDLIAEEKSFIERDNLLDLEANKDLFGAFRTANADKTITKLIRDPAGLKAFAEEQRAKGLRIPDNFQTYALTELRTLSGIEESRTEGEKISIQDKLGQARQDAANAQRDSEALQSQIDQTAQRYGADDAADFTGEILQGELVDMINTEIQNSGLDIDDWWDSVWKDDPSALTEQIVKEVPELNKWFKQNSDELKQAAVRRAAAETKAVGRRLLPKYQQQGLKGLEALKAMQEDPEYLRALATEKKIKEADALQMNKSIVKNIFLTPQYMFNTGLLDDGEVNLSNIVTRMKKDMLDTNTQAHNFLIGTYLGQMQVNELSARKSLKDDAVASATGRTLNLQSKLGQ